MEEEQIEDLTRELNELKIREAVLIAAIARLQAAPANVKGIEVGNRVWIKNKVRKPAHWPTQTPWIESEYRTARVTKISTRQIFVLTDNGVDTWRALNNLQRITE
jgi:hypothetical protein